MKDMVPVNTILETAGLTRQSTFREHCYKAIKEEGQFGMTVLAAPHTQVAHLCVYCFDWHSWLYSEASTSHIL